MENNIKVLRKTSKQYPFQFLTDIFRNVDKETQEKTGDKYWTWSEQYDNWIDIIQPLLRSSSDNSLLQIRFVEFNRILLWIQTCVYCGQYYSALRELRFLLEFILKAYYVDKKYPNYDIELKIEKEKWTYGNRLIKQLDVEEKTKTELKILYSDLSEYTHPSKKELAEMLKGEYSIHLTFSFNETMFNKCRVLTNKVVDSIFFIILNRYRNMILEFENNELLIKSLKELDCNLTLEILNK